MIPVPNRRLAMIECVYDASNHRVTRQGCGESLFRAVDK